MRDPLYRKIVEALDGSLDPGAFEECAQALLRNIYPTLVPIRGGDDGGFDGAFATDEGQYPLICTIDKNGPLVNFRKNISTYLSQEVGPRKAVIATPRALTPRKRRNLERIASEDYGILIVAIHDQASFSDLLYRDAKWRRELLGLTGRPPALSVLPPRSRQEKPPLIGREEDVHWLNEQDGDLLLVGQPGIGKTYLHEALVREDEALFAVDEDPGALADAIRDQNPRVIIVDDAHTRIELIRTLKRLREELGCEFRIHTNCWPHAESELRATLDVLGPNVRQLTALTGQEIVQVIKGIGLVGPDDLLRLILSQAMGKPGLAAVLVSAIKRGDGNRVWVGETIAEQLLYGQQVIGDSRAQAVLAGIALSGDRGIPLDDVASCLGLPPGEVRAIVTDLAAGGVVEDSAVVYDGGDHRLAVQPEVLRGVLIRDVFFQGTATLDIEPFLAQVISDSLMLRGAAHSLMAAKQRGAAVSNDLLFKLAIELDHPEVWHNLSYVDESCAENIIEKHPEKVIEAATGLLRMSPERAVLSMFRYCRDFGDEKSPQMVEQILDTWLSGDPEREDDTILSRKFLATAIKAYAAEEEQPPCASLDWALSLLIMPNVNFYNTVPGDWRTVQLYRGLRTLEELQEISGFWPDVLAGLQQFHTVPHAIRDAIEGWCLPQRYANSDSVLDSEEFMKQTGREMLSDIAALESSGPATRTWVKDTATWANLSVDVQLDPMFHRMFCDREHADDYETRSRRTQLLRHEVADQVMLLGPKAGVQRLVECENEAKVFGWRGGWRRYEVYGRIAETVPSVLEWLIPAIDHGLPSEHVHAFIQGALRRGQTDVYDLLPRMLHDPRYADLARRVVLCMHSPPEEMLDAVIKDDESEGRIPLSQLVNQVVMASGTLERLLTHTERAVRINTAIAVWRQMGDKSIDASLIESWHFAVLECWNEDGHVLSEILQADTALAISWAERKIDEASVEGDRQFRLWEVQNIFGRISKLLSAEQRWQLLDRLDMDSFQQTVANALMQDDAELFLRWFRKHHGNGESGEYMALKPLDRPVDDTWEIFAIAALDHGLKSTVLATRIGRHGSGVISGPVSEYYQKLIPTYEGLLNHKDVRLHEAGKKGISWATNSMEQEIKKERFAAIRTY